MVVVIPGTAEALGQHAEVLATNETDAGLQFTAVKAGAWESLTATTSIGSWAPSPPVGGALTLAASGPGAKIRRWTGAPKGRCAHRTSMEQQMPLAHVTQLANLPEPFVIRRLGRWRQGLRRANRGRTQRV